MSSDGPLKNLKNFIWFTFSHHGLMKKNTMIITCQQFHLNEMDLKLINVGKYWAHQFAYPPSLSNIVWCLHVLAWFLVKQSIHMQQQIIAKWYCLQYKFRELTSLVFMNNDNLEYSCFKGKFMLFVVIIHNIWDKNIYSILLVVTLSKGIWKLLNENHYNN
jgi:hypothetical protein